MDRRKLPSTIKIKWNIARAEIAYYIGFAESMILHNNKFFFRFSFLPFYLSIFIVLIKEKAITPSAQVHIVARTLRARAQPWI